MEEATPIQGETGTPKAPENVTPTQTPTQGNVSDTAVEQLRKEKEQAEMRANQLANQLKAREEAEAKAKAKELEEQNEFKTLYEQEKAKRESIEAEREAEASRKELEKARNEVLNEYPEEVKALATDLGIVLNSSEEDAKAEFKEKLDKIAKRESTSGKVTPNNPRVQNNQSQMTQSELRQALRDPAKFQEIVAKRKGIAVMMDKRQQ